MPTPNNPPLFRFKRHEEEWAGHDHHVTDITLRDLFAGMAMQGMAGNEKFIEVLNREGLDGDQMRKVIASASYSQASAMLEARHR